MARPLQDSVVLLGDSITSRQDVPDSLQARFCHAYRRTLDVLNRGYGGYNTTLVMPLFDHIFAKKEDGARFGNIRLITIWFGANDACIPPSGQHVPLGTYTSNLHTYLKLLTSSDSPYAVAHSSQPLSIILITPPPFDPETLDQQLRTRDFETSKKYRQAVLDVGREWAGKEEKDGRWKVVTVDCWGGIMEASKQGGLARFFTDGLHLSKAGYDVVWEEIDRLLHSELKGRGVTHDDQVELPFTVPDFSTIDLSRPQSVIEGMKNVR